ncbi:MAG: bifunctional aspartate kinase/homoserine dehydrogenase I [Pseudomonadota bacterium]
MTWEIHKFGGSSLARADAFHRAVGLVSGSGDARRGVVVSALGGVTDDLHRLVEAAAAGRDLTEALGALHDRHDTMASDLGVAVPDAFAVDRDNLRDLLHAVQLVGSADRIMSDLIFGYGERWSARLFTAALTAAGRPARFLDAGEFIIAADGDMGPVVDWDGSLAALEPLVAGWDGDVVMTGYVARYGDGRPRTLWRNGSDFSAAILGRLLAAEAVQIWTDVPGVMSADPRLVPEARVLQTLSYDEALELAYFGAAVLHPQTLAPAIAAQIPVFIRDPRTPGEPGTRIADISSTRFAIKGITAIPEMALVTLEGAGLIGVPGTARRLFGCLERGGISVVMISQGSSEHSICVAVPRALAADAVLRIREEFTIELRAGLVQSVRDDTDAAVLAVVGSSMAGQPGVAASFFSALSRCGINIKAIAQGASERNISAVVPNDEAARAVRAVHSAFYLSPQTVSVGLLGVGHVGGALLEQLVAQAPKLTDRVDLRIRAIARSRTMLLGEDLTAPPGNADPELDIEALVEHVAAEHLPHSVIIDCTADDAVAARHPEWLARGIDVVTPNKKGVGAGWARYEAIQRAMAAAGSRYGCETTVGAGLPIIHTLRDLVDTGDRVIEIEGMLSGTLAWLFHRFDGSEPFSELVREAWQAGYTEPDPRDDLSGLDVARKLVILARQIGLKLNLDHIKVDGLVPAELDGGDVETFLAAFAEHDDAFATRIGEARTSGGVLRFVAHLDASGTASVGLRTIGLDHPFAMAQATDNVVRFRTVRYDANPLVVQGPGAGPEVTAAGVFADLLRLAGTLGGRGG